MGCLIILLALLSPRLALIAMWLLNDLLSESTGEWWVALIGFFVLPWTTLAYAGLWSSGDAVQGFEWFIVGLAFLADVASWGGSRRGRD